MVKMTKTANTPRCLRTSFFTLKQNKEVKKSLLGFSNILPMLLDRFNVFWESDKRAKASI